MNGSFDLANGRQFTGWTAIIAAVAMVATLVMSGIASGSDPNLFYDPARALALSPDKIGAYRLYLLADVFGFYLPLIVIGTYLWRRLRDQAGVVADMALLFLVIHVILGVVGAALQYGTLVPLVAAHSGGGSGLRSAAETAWLTTIWGAARGIWLMEGPVVAFWGISTGLAMRAQGMSFGLLLVVVVLLYVLTFVSLCVGLVDLSNIFIVGAILLQTVWTALLGISMLRERSV